jgi:hypothetical protein
MACGYEPATERGIAWRGASSLSPTVCPGYTCKLPEVIEVSRLRAHWKVGALGLAADQPTPQLLDAILELDWSINEVEAWSLDNPVKKA